MTRSLCPLALGALACLGLPQQAAAKRALPPLITPDDAAARDRLLIPSASRDHSAFRHDTEVFGWSADLKEVGAVVMEVARGPRGKHRGECYMLVYGVDEWVPRHNVITHSITHADLPHAPVPLKEAKDFLWSIEFSYQTMWPHRPQRAFRKGDMSVETVWAPMPTGEPEICRPWVAAKVTYKKQSRLMPYRPMDLTARCSLLRKSDTRTYWATPTLTASMVRFDFAGRVHNEESARFLFSSHWSHAKSPRVEIVAPPSMAKGAEFQRFKKLVSHVAPTQVQWTPSPSASAISAKGAADLSDLWEADVEGGHDWLPLAIGALSDLSVGLGRIRAVDGPLRAPSQVAPAEAKPPSATPARPGPPPEASRLQGALAAARRPRFGHDAVGGESSMPGRGPALLAGESGMVDDIVTQHDPIEDAFGDEPPSAPSAARARQASESTENAKATQSVVPPKPSAPASPDVLRIVLRPKSAPRSSDSGGRPAASDDAEATPAPASSGPKERETQAPKARFLDDWQP